MKNPFFEWKIRGRQRRVWWGKNKEMAPIVLLVVVAFLVTGMYFVGLFQYIEYINEIK